MRFIHLYLIGYFILVVGAGLALRQAGVLAQVSAVWIAISAIIVIGLEPFSPSCSARAYRNTTILGRNEGSCCYAKVRTALGIILAVTAGRPTTITHE